jgi:hypothetical protein
MGIYDDIKVKGAAYRLTEESLYAETLREIESGQQRDGIWAKAMAESDMDQGKAGAKYIKLRVQSLKDEVTIFIAELNRTQKIEKVPDKVEAKSTVTAPRLGGFGRAWLRVLIGLSVLFLFVGLPLALYQDGFKWGFLIGVLFWIAVWQGAYNRLYHQKKLATAPGLALRGSHLCIPRNKNT